MPLGGLFALVGAGLMVLAPQHQNGWNSYAIPTRHPVTPEMKQAAASLERKPAPDFTLSDQDGVQVTRADLKGGKPSVLFFIKDGCPCSIEAQPIFNDLARAYGGDAQFFGVIDGHAQEATTYLQANTVPFRLITDPTKGLMRAFKMEASASMALVDGNGQIVQVWPGYSKSTLRQLNFLLGALAKVPPREFNDRDAPEELTAGCSFF